MRTVEWNYDTNKFQMIDQRLLPGEFKVAVFDDYRAVAQAITDMVVRGAPAIGGAAAFGLALAAQQSDAKDYTSLHTDLETAANHIKQARPTRIPVGVHTVRIHRDGRQFRLQTEKRGLVLGNTTNRNTQSI